LPDWQLTRLGLQATQRMTNAAVLCFGSARLRLQAGSVLAE
jgi:hypothetical protein